jgi:N6-L-threonylcarbamoyladenine synthase
MGLDVILAIESSCDETAVAAVDSHGHVVSQRILSQIPEHNRFGGVVPELAARSHFRELDALVELCLKDIGDRPIRAVAATTGPGLIGPLLVGAQYAKGLAIGWNKAFIGVHHLRGHLASVLLEHATHRPMSESAESIFPAWVLLVSGGHTQVLDVDSKLWARQLATTADDAAGECFDKTAKLMGLPYPGGPQIEACAKQLADPGKAEALLKTLPRAQSELGFSFSGLKTAIRLKLEKNPTLKQDPAMCFAVQKCIAETLERGLAKFESELKPDLKTFVFCGGVSANAFLRERLLKFAQSRGLQAIFPPLKFATDNAAMIAAAAWVQDPALQMPLVEARRPLNPESRA